MNRIDDTESIEDKLTTLKIRNDSNEYIIQMKYTDTIKKLKEYIEKKLLYVLKYYINNILMIKDIKYNNLL